MPIDDQRGWALLRRLDDPAHLEFPPGYDEAATRARFHRLVARLNEKFGCTCGVDRVVQDASYHGTITIPPAATACGQHVTVTISNFGGLAAVTSGVPGAPTGGAGNEPFRTVDRPRVEGELEALDYVSISENLLWTRYDRDDGSASFAPPRYFATWWIRFFDYL
jgi:hypothetical protein